MKLQKCHLVIHFYDKMSYKTDWYIVCTSLSKQLKQINYVHKKEL